MCFLWLPGLINKWRDNLPIDLIFLLRLMFTVLADESDPHSGWSIDPWQVRMAVWLVPRALPCLLTHEQQGMTSGKWWGNCSSPGSARQCMGKGHVGAWVGEHTLPMHAGSSETLSSNRLCHRAAWQSGSAKGPGWVATVHIIHHLFSHSCYDSRKMSFTLAA